MRVFRAVCLLAAGAAVASCGSDSSDGAITGTPATTSELTSGAASPDAADTRTAPAGALPLGAGTGEGGALLGTPLAAGTYYSESFSPRVVLTLGDGWGNAGQQSNQFLLLLKPEPGDIALTIDSSGTLDVPETLAKLTALRGADAGGVTDTVVAGIPAKRFDITIVQEEGAVRIPTLADVYSSFKGDVLRVWLLEVDGRTVKILAEAPGAEFPQYAEVAEAVVATISFQ